MGHLQMAIFIFFFTLFNLSSSKPSESECVLDFQLSSSQNSTTCDGGDWGGFLGNSCCSGVFHDYLQALGQRANQTRVIFLNFTQQTACLAKGNGSGEEGDALGCGIEKLTSGGGGCSDFSVDDVTSKLRNELKNLDKSCQFANPDEDERGESCGACVRSWKDIRGSHNNIDAESDICRFAVLTSLTSSRIQDKTWIWKIHSCLAQQDANLDIQTGKHKASIGIYAIIGIPVGITVILATVIWILLRRRRIRMCLTSKKEAIKSISPKKFSYLRVSVKEVYAATDSLSESNLIGEGTAGKVYRGILSNKQQVAVKHIVNDRNAETFLREVSSLEHVRHPNLVALLGFCENEDEFFLIYEFCPNGNLSEWIFGKDRVLSWIQRLEIAVGCARGLWFLHTYPEGSIVHRDIKPTNILLGKNFEAKLSDFGLSKVMEFGESHVSSEVRGTFGYVDPEYQNNRIVNSSGDVYSFGIVLLQIISGQKCINMNLSKPMSLDKMAKSLSRGGSKVEFSDPKLDGEYSSEAFDLVFSLAVSCTLPKLQRPSMEQVALTLEKALLISTSAKASTPHATPDWSRTSY